jgi:magnesium transporter
MLTAFVRSADDSARQFDTVDALAEAWSKDQGAVWVDLEAPSDEELRSVGCLLHLDDAALDDCLHGEQRARIDEYDEYTFMVLYGAIGSGPDAEFQPRKLAVFCGPRFLVTVHQEPLRTIRTLRERCARHPAVTLANGLDALLYHIIDLMVDNLVDLANKYEDRLEELEETSLASGVDASILQDVLGLRRELLELRRVAASQHELLSPLAAGEFDYISESLGPRFSHVRDHLMHVVELIDAQRERLTGVRDHYHTALATRANEIMRTLTLFAAVLLPLSVIAGIYGMNLPIWPSAESPFSFLIVVAAMMVLALGLLYYFKRRKWL